MVNAWNVTLVNIYWSNKDYNQTSDHETDIT